MNMIPRIMAPCKLDDRIADDIVNFGFTVRRCDRFPPGFVPFTQISSFSSVEVDVPPHSVSANVSVTLFVLSQDTLELEENPSLHFPFTAYGVIRTVDLPVQVSDS